MSAGPLSEDWGDISGKLADKVRVHRDRLGMTQETLAEKTGLSRNQIQNIEANRNNQNGPANPQLDTVFALAHALQIEVTYLIDPRTPIQQ